ncbi:DUF4431 domain-containing protein [Chitinimonas sp.]|uniref:DUF4431 domain-containing protein n=1 Tax=Chitinimonas sp. TaxID=1934313 RepID=UPI0035AF5D21
MTNRQNRGPMQVLVLLALWPWVSGIAASFDCQKARSPAEKLICQDSELSRLDEELSGLYQLVKRQVGDSKAFQQQTRASWKQREQCTDKACLQDWYRRQQANLSRQIGAPCLSYRQPVALSGKLQRLTFAGPPNFESVARGDAAETGFYLKLGQPVCTTGNPDDDEMYLPQRGVALVQLVLDTQGYAALRPYLDQSISLQGRLFAQHTGHHHAPLLLESVTLGKP